MTDVDFLHHENRLHGPGSNPQTWVQKASDKATTPRSRLGTMLIFKKIDGERELKSSGIIGPTSGVNHSNFRRMIWWEISDGLEWETDIERIWGCLRSTDSMAGKAVSLHSLLANRNGQIKICNCNLDGDLPSLLPLSNAHHTKNYNHHKKSSVVVYGGHTAKEVRSSSVMRDFLLPVDSGVTDASSAMGAGCSGDSTSPKNHC
ncbi:hypothetical protein TNCV_4330821 [Trichonephila clavipes]|nr:hypothetical protein TNCV_4330821 [Trichonephila clavipes]